MKIVILNGYGEDNAEMAFYVDGKLIKIATIDGSNECPESVLDFMHEFGLSPEDIGATELSDVVGEPDSVSCNLLYDEELGVVKPFPEVLIDEILVEYLS